MKIKSHLAYYISLSILVVLMLAAFIAVLPDPRSVKGCKQSSYCVVTIPSFYSWPSFH